MDTLFTEMQDAGRLQLVHVTAPLNTNTTTPTNEKKETTVMTATTKKTTKPAAKPAANKPATPKAWTDAEIAQLRDRVAKADTASAAIKEHAKASGRSEATVQQKWYTVKKKENGGKKTAAKGAGKRSARTMATPKAIVDRIEQKRGTAALNGDGDHAALVRSLDSSSLAALIRAAREELTRRENELAQVREALAG